MHSEQSGDERSAVLDRMIAFAMEELLSGNGARRQQVVRRMAEIWPREPALSLVFALTSATGAIEDAFGTAAAAEPVVPFGYKLSALVSADIHAVQCMGQVPSMAEDLLHFWRRTDPQYLQVH